MAITILRNTSIRNTPKSKITLPLRQVINLKVKATGEITDGKGTPIENLFLGNQYEDAATVIHFDLEDLYLRGLFSNEATDFYTTLSTKYRPRLFFLTPQGDKIAFDFNGVDFYVPYDVTQLNGEYRILYTLKERDWEGENKGNTGQAVEDFVSDEFYGFVNEVPLLDESKTTTIQVEELELNTLKKPTIHLALNERKQIELRQVGGKILGHAQDKYITDVKLSGLTADLTITYSLYFINREKDFAVRSIANSNDKVWIPSLVTKNAGVYDLVVAAETNNGEQFYSNVINMEVKSNFLDENDMLGPVTEGSVLLTIDNLFIYVL